MALGKKALAIGLAAAFLAPAAADAWTKTYVVEWLEPAMYYGGPADGVETSPGTDCPQGIGDMDWRKMLVTSYRTRAQSEAINNAEYGRAKFLAHLAFRGANRENVYENPTSVADPGQLEVAGHIAEGFDLDGDPNTGFTSPTGEKGVDNAFYKAGGCMLTFRAKPRGAQGFKIINDEMHDGSFTVVFVFSGEKDPMNDDDVRVGVYSSKDKMVKDANGKIALDYTFRITPDPHYGSVFKAKVVNGVLETTAPTTFVSHDLIRMLPAPLILEKAKARFVFKEDGTAEGLVGGYRDFFSHFRAVIGDGHTIQGAIRENLGHFDAAAWYYAMRREADGLPDPKTGLNRGISTTYRYHLVPAIVVNPEGQTALSAFDAASVAGAEFGATPDAEDARLAIASFEPISAVAQAKRIVRRVSFRDPFGTTTMPNIVLEKTVDGAVSYTLTANSGKIRETGAIAAQEWSALTAMDAALAPARRGFFKAKAPAQVCHSKAMVIEAAERGKTVRREASVCGGADDTAAVLYGYKIAELVMKNLPRCAGYIESGREYSWTLTECLRPKRIVGYETPNDYDLALGAN